MPSWSVRLARNWRKSSACDALVQFFLYTHEDIDVFHLTDSDILTVDAHVLYKDKAETCRIAAKGNLLPSQPGELNFSDVCHDDHKKTVGGDACACAAGDWSQAEHQLL